ncbi:ADAM 17-like protease [Blattella germanica]|nr:ADAM 17-like protease [Blattella germanica]
MLKMQHIERRTLWLFEFLFICCLLMGTLNEVSCSIHKNLKHFETLHASQFSHNIVKRGVKHSDHPFNKIREVSFTTLGRDFRLILTPKKGILHSKFKAYTVDGDGQEKPVFVDHENFYEGRLFGEVTSDASVHLEDGVMTATIRAPEETYHIEFVADHEEDEEEVRHKRQAEQYEYTPTKTRCPLLLVADYRFYQEMGGSNTKTTINYLISLIDRVHKIYNDTTWQDRQEQDGFKGMGFVIKKIVVHSEPTRVRGGEAHYNMVREKWDVRNLLEVFARYDDLPNYCLAHLFTHQTFRGETSTVLGLAYIASPKVFSREYSHKDFCLAHLFTDLKFEGGILGLAYVGSPRRNSVGGICTPVADACKRCCRMNLNDTCFPVDPQDILPDGTPCIQGFCNKGMCEKTIQDVVERFWDIIEDININKVLVFLKDNIVGTVILVTAIIWIPASCVVSYVDRRRRNAQEATARWKHSGEFYRDEDRHVISISVPRHRTMFSAAPM